MDGKLSMSITCFAELGLLDAIGVEPMQRGDHGSSKALRFAKKLANDSQSTCRSGTLFSSGNRSRPSFLRGFWSLLTDFLPIAAVFLWDVERNDLVAGSKPIQDPASRESGSFGAILMRVCFAKSSESKKLDASFYMLLARFLSWHAHGGHLLASCKQVAMADHATILPPQSEQLYSESARRAC